MIFQKRGITLKMYSAYRAKNVYFMHCLKRTAPDDTQYTIWIVDWWKNLIIKNYFGIWCTRTRQFIELNCIIQNICVIWFISCELCAAGWRMYLCQQLDIMSKCASDNEYKFISNVTSSNSGFWIYNISLISKIIES